MCYGYHIWSKEALMQAENDDDLDGGQRSSEVKWGKLCAMATIFGQKNHWCKLGMMMTFMEVKANRGQIQWIIFVLHVPLWYLVSRWGVGSKVCMHHFGCGNGMNWIKGYYMIVKVKIETFWFSTYSMQMQSLTSSSFIICLWGETFGSRTIFFFFFCPCFRKNVIVTCKIVSVCVLYGFYLVRLLVRILICAILEWSINNKMVSKI